MVGDGFVAYANFADQRLYVQRGGDAPRCDHAGGIAMPTVWRMRAQPADLH